jgi:hypothetical protein
MIARCLSFLLIPKQTEMLTGELSLLLDRPYLHRLPSFKQEIIGFVETSHTSIGLNAGVPGIALFLKL